MKVTKNVRGTVILLFTLNLSTLCECVRNNVCRTFADYRTIANNPNCWYNSDIDSTPEQIVKRYGFPFESHEVTTEDGYIVTLFRIPHNGSDIHRKRPVVFFQHGIAADGYAWMTSGLKSSVFIFSNQGYDVWISNCRGTEYSAKHVRLTTDDRKYWLYSFHEMALYDIPAMLNYVSKKTNQYGRINYIGHSMGCTMAFIYASLMPQQARHNLKSIIALAPVAYMDHVKSAAKVLVPYRYVIWNVLTSFGFYGISPRLQNTLNLSYKLCSNYPFIKVCLTITALLSGINSMESNAGSFPIGIRHFPTGLSLKTLFHYAQIIDADRRFQFFDYGPELNWKLYNSTQPPEYPVENINVPVHLIYGNNDFLSVDKDVFYLYDKLTTEKTIKEAFNFSHLDFLSSVHSPDLFNMLFEYL